ncbi:DUF917 domain-containing protein [Geosporobacter ferrireducens]|uniref:OsrF n=1 Tax=Geosporobacter ferrireducens TaxID=1424294 RepID=A0A1D8GM21_9FIRM|nr:DUF917 family protein [Geosporobacter ferrireducens]AOT71964.1 hypothetical protein Gferi_21935 [Geosporobacter ferrireducens]MTI55831.1 DUF917 family protein [Geosporobacter ferrireducens]
MKGRIKLNKEMLKYALIGGTILGGGGGGSMALGETSGNIALDYGELELVDIDEIEEDALIVTASAVGAPAAIDKYVKPRDYVRAVEILQENTGFRLGGIITNENGGAATINGWIQAAILNIPLIDAPCNGRAHPTGTMGSMGLNNVPNFISYQAFAGGNPELGNRIEGFFKGDISKTAALIRQSAVRAGGLVAVARNVVEAEYVKKNGAIHGISHAIETGKKFYEGLEISPCEAIKEVAAFLKGEIVVEGAVSEFELVTDGGFDVGRVVVSGIEMTFWNEYMTLEVNRNRLFTFPDLIMSFDKASGLPLTTAEIKKDQQIVIIATKKENLKLGSGMFDHKLLKEIEPIVNREVLKYI